MAQHNKSSCLIHITLLKWVTRGSALCGYVGTQSNCSYSIGNTRYRSSGVEQTDQRSICEPFLSQKWYSSPPPDNFIGHKQSHIPVYQKDTQKFRLQRSEAEEPWSCSPGDVYKTNWNEWIKREYHMHIISKHGSKYQNLLKSQKEKWKRLRRLPLVSLASNQHGEQCRAGHRRPQGCVVSFLALFDFFNYLSVLFLLNCITYFLKLLEK